MNQKQKTILIMLLAVHLVLLYLVLSRNLDFLFNDASHRIGPGSDFWALYNAGKHWRLGDNIYMRGPGYGFRYHPIFAMTILSYLSYLAHQPAYWLWVAINEIFLVMFLVVARRMIVNTAHFLVACAVMVGFSPYYLEVYMGNASFIAAAVLLMAIYLLQRRAQLGAYITYLVSILIKPVGLALLPILLLRRRFATVFLTLVIIAGLALPYFIVHPNDWYDFARVNFEGFSTTPGFMVHGGNQGFYGLMVMISAFANHVPTRELYNLTQFSDFSRILIRVIPYFFIAVSGLATYRLRRTDNLYILVFLWSATYLLGYKDVWEHSYAFLVLGLLMLYLSRAFDPRLLLILSGAIALPTLFAFYDIPMRSLGISDPGWYWDFKTSLLHHATKPVFLLALYLLSLRKAFTGRVPNLPESGSSPMSIAGQQLSD
ncbi:MAG: glycosyltransferase 87 family protein [Candidatus Zixiibacteriota bacterium]